jgi:hypothetical protein
MDDDDADADNDDDADDDADDARGGRCPRACAGPGAGFQGLGCASVNHAPQGTFAGICSIAESIFLQ